MKVLFATPSRALARSVDKLLTLYGYTVAIAYDGVQAMMALGDQTYDVLVADYSLPRLSAAVLLRQCPPTMGSIGILPSSRIPEGDSGFDILLPQPFAAQSLLDALARLAQPVPSATYRDVTLDYNAKALCVGGRSVHCTLAELDLINRLLSQTVATSASLGQAIGSPAPLDVFRAVHALDAKLRAARLGLVLQPVQEGYKVGRV